MVWLRVGILAAPGASKSFQIVITHFWGIQPTPRPKSNEEIIFKTFTKLLGFGIRNPSELLKWFGQALMELGPRCSASMITFGGRKLQKINHIAAVSQKAAISPSLPRLGSVPKPGPQVWGSTWSTVKQVSIALVQEMQWKILPPGRPLQGCADSHHWLSAAGLQFTAENMFNYGAIVLVGAVPVTQVKTHAHTHIYIYIYIHHYTSIEWGVISVSYIYIYTSQLLEMFTTHYCNNPNCTSK